MARSAPTPALEAAPLWGFAAGALAGGLIGALAAFAGGPLGDGRLAMAGPSGWQVAVVAILEVGVASAITAGLANWLWVRRSARAAAAAAGPGSLPPGPLERDLADEHTIYLDPWAGDAQEDASRSQAAAQHGPASLP
jgi:hypothetical protein